MWEQFELRLEAEHFLGPAVRANALIGRYADTSALTGDAQFRRALDALTYVDRRAVYNGLVELTGGPAGLAGGTADGGSADAARKGQPYRDRLAELRLIASTAMKEAEPRPGDLAEQDLAAVQACAPIDRGIEAAVRAAVSGQPTDDDVIALAAAVRHYRAITGSSHVSEGGRRLLGFKVATALDSLARACVTLRRDAEAETHFAAAAALYSDSGEEHQAQACAQKRDAAAQRRVPDADSQLKQLLANLDTAPAPSVDRAAVLVGLAELAHGNGDDFEARALAGRLDDGTCRSPLRHPGSGWHGPCG